MRVFNEFDSRAAASASLAAAVAADLEAALAADRTPSVVLCGGSSPLELFTALADKPLDWSRVTVVPSDERWVPVEDDASNQGLLRRTLFQGPAARAHMLGFYQRDCAPADALAGIDASLAELGGAFDHVVLGMGGDGHTASLFPHAANIDAILAERARVTVPELPAGETRRVSLSVPSLVSARAISVLFFGADKRTIFERAAAGAVPRDLPIAAIMNNAPVPVRVFWAP